MGSKRRQRRGQIDVESMRNIRCECGKGFVHVTASYRQAQVEEIVNCSTRRMEPTIAVAGVMRKAESRKHVEDLMGMSRGGSSMSIALMT